MKAANWGYGLLCLAVLVAMLELPRHIHGSEWAVTVAAICIQAVGAFIIWKIVGHLDRLHAQERRRKSEQASQDAS